MVDRSDALPAAELAREGDSEPRKRFEAIVADADDGVVILEPNGVIGYANDAAEFLLGRGTHDLVDLRIEPLAAGPEGTLVLRLKDVTAYHRRVADALDEVRRRDEFLAMLSHELRNPLAAIRNSSMLLASDDVDTQSRGEAAAVLDRQFAHLGRILDDLLDVARILRGKLAIVSERVDLNQALKDAADAVSHLVRQRGHRFDLDLPSRALWVRGDATRLEQVFVNLLNNAIKFTPDGGRLAMSAKVERETATIEVRDDGPGISRDLLPRIFEPFVQGPQTLDRSDGGLGIGLMLVRTFVELHGGSVDVRSDGEGSGTTFVLRLPLMEVAAEAPSGDSEDQSRRTLRILLVEDNEDARRMLRLLLRTQGHDVVEAANGHDGLAVALERSPDVALVDIGLPGIDGYEVARRLRGATGGRIPRLVALTGYGTPEDVKAAHDAGFDDHLVKPVAFRDLCRLLDACPREAAKRLDEEA